MSEKVYESIPQEEDELGHHSDITITKKGRNSQQLCIYVVFGLMLATIIALTTILLYPTTTPTPKYTDCGGTPALARARNCHFDILSFAWQTAECYDHENTEAFRLHNGNTSSWTYYTSQNATEQRSEVDALSGEHDTWVTAGYHHTHCTYMWRQLHRAYTLRGFVDSHVDSWNHTLHCQSVMLREPSVEQMTEVNTWGKLRYPTCRKIW